MSMKGMGTDAMILKDVEQLQPDLWGFGTCAGGDLFSTEGVGFPNQELISADMEPETLRKPGAATGNWGWTKQLL